MTGLMNFSTNLIAVGGWMKSLIFYTSSFVLGCALAFAAHALAQDIGELPALAIYLVGVGAHVACLVVNDLDRYGAR